MLYVLTGIALLGALLLIAGLVYVIVDDRPLEDLNRRQREAAQRRAPAAGEGGAASESRNPDTGDGAPRDPRRPRRVA